MVSAYDGGLDVPLETAFKKLPPSFLFAEAPQPANAPIVESEIFRIAPAPFFASSLEERRGWPVWRGHTALQMQRNRGFDPENSISDEAITIAPILINEPAKAGLDAKRLRFGIGVILARPPEGGLFDEGFPDALGRRGDFDFEFHQPTAPDRA
jgi:hypothetical protein